MDEPKEITSESLRVDSDSVLDSILDKGYDRQETPEDSSSLKENQSEQSEKAEDAGANQSKKAESSEDEESKDEPKDPRDVMFRKGYNEAKSKLTKELEELRKVSLPKEEIENFKKTISSPEYIRFSMKQQGYRDEAIDAKLKELGHVSNATELDLNDVIMKKLNINPQAFSNQEEFERSKGITSDVITITKSVLEQLIPNYLGKEITPLKENLNQIMFKESANHKVNEMQKIIKDEGILEWKEVEPELNKFMDENKGISQDDVVDYFKDLRHKMVVSKLQSKGKKDERDEKKSNLRSLSEGANISQGKILRKAGQSDSEYMDSILDSHQVR